MLYFQLNPDEFLPSTTFSGRSVRHSFLFFFCTRGMFVHVWHVLVFVASTYRIAQEKNTPRDEFRGRFSPKHTPEGCTKKREWWLFGIFFRQRAYKTKMAALGRSHRDLIENRELIEIPRSHRYISSRFHRDLIWISRSLRDTEIS